MSKFRIADISFIQVEEVEAKVMGGTGSDVNYIKNSIYKDQGDYKLQYESAYGSFYERDGNSVVKVSAKASAAVSGIGGPVKAEADVNVGRKYTR
ncbi:MAG: hypothetical protein IGS39_14905 [Calothrix sp. C42_A2020_038]|nr:hypothetical protein [Calothrix sp. C42_A2020_038]